ncbi:uncharacterized protein I303_107501 [Kwoniella dejecticola CBS 10117]|uniref:Uncharacterized protein n=1 Tax=Kwoniella dejecticola CBS 10117 TaxID=1296121 RepID=A0A1A5ZZV5_9TREE|nr:uncharacterized protein I303_06906 [Kwoniella dejecticola CBS 10117]OBR83341.1 hypothetical protein I303_06906 [Kwoniella dejecticola CBS 10117]
MVLVGLLPILAFAGSIQAAALPVGFDSPPPSPALSLQGSATFSPIPTFSPQLNVPSPTLPSAPSVPSVPSHGQTGEFNGSDRPNSNANANADTTAEGKYNGGDARGNAGAGAGVGRGQGMTNAERIKRGLGILPPTRRMTGRPTRRSEKPVPQINAAQFRDPQQQQQQQNQDIPTEPGNPDIGNASGNQGNDYAAKKYAMRMKNPEDGSDMGLVGSPDGDNPLIGYTPTTDGALKMTMPNDPTSTPFLIGPSNDGSGENNNNNNGNDGNGSGDDDAFNGPRKVLAAVPHKGLNGSDLKQGDGNFAPLGMGWKDASGLLHLGIEALLNLPQSGDLRPTSGTIPGLPISPDTDTVQGIPKQLLSGLPRPGGSVLPDPIQGLPSSSDTIKSLPVPGALDESDGSDTDPTHLLHGSISDLPLNPSTLTSKLPTSAIGKGSALRDGDGDANVLGDPQSTLWTFHPSSQRLLAHYVNSDGNTVPTYFVTGGECAHTICLTADVEAFKDAQGDDAHEVHVLAEALVDL